MVDSVLLLLLFAMAGSLIAALSAGGASGLMGAFLAGLSFCTIRSIEHVWKVQVKRLQTWLIRIFFACTIGFDVPVKLYKKRAVIRHAAVFWAATFGKLFAGFFAVPLAAPQVATLGLAMASLGEFSFIGACLHCSCCAMRMLTRACLAPTSTVGKSAKTDLHLMSSETYAAVTLAVLATIIISPTLLGYALDWQHRRAEAEIAAAARAAASPAGGVVYYKLDIKVTNRWGLLGDINRCLAQHDVDVIEFRVDLKGDFSLYEAYLKDNKLRAPRPGAVTFPELASRLFEIKAGLMEVLAHDPKAAAAELPDSEAGGGENLASVSTVNFAALRGIKLERWMPGAGPEEWDEAGAIGNEEQATLIMRREAEATQRRNVFDIFGHAAPTPAKALARMAAFEEGEESELTPPPSSKGSSAVDALQRAASLKPVTSNGGGTGTGTGTPQRTSLDLERRPSLDQPGGLIRSASTSLASALAAMASRLSATTSVEHNAGGDLEADEAGGATVSPASHADEPSAFDAFDPSDVDRAIARARTSVYQARKAEQDDAHGLLGIVRRHKARGVETEATELDAAEGIDEEGGTPGVASPGSAAGVAPALDTARSASPKRPRVRFLEDEAAVAAQEEPPADADDAPRAPAESPTDDAVAPSEEEASSPPLPAHEEEEEQAAPPPEEEA